MAPHPCVAVMAKRPDAGLVKTRLAAALGQAGAARLARAMLGDTRTALVSLRDAQRCWFHAPADAGAWFAELDPGARLLPQPEAHFGARLEHGFAELLRAGHDGVLFVAGDAPHIPAACLEDALRRLADHDLVLGPCEDGGYYLIGLRAPVAGLFEGVRWSSAHTLTDTLARAAERDLRVHLTAPGFDVDDAADLRRLAALPELAARCPQTAACLAELGERGAT